MNKKSKFWPWALAWLILAILSCYIRLYPLWSHMWDNAHEQATLTGYWQPFTLHPYWGFVIYKTLKLLDPNIPLMSAVAYTPLFSYLLILIAFLWVCRVLNYSVIASFIGALFLIMAPINLKYGSLGCFSADPYNILFPLLLLGQLFLALRPHSKKYGYWWAIIFGLTLSIYALFCQGWGLLFFMSAACALGAASYNFFIKKDPVHARQNLLFLSIFIGATLLVLSVCFSFQHFFTLLKEGFGELKKTSPGSFTYSVGGPVFMLLALGGWSYSMRLTLNNFPQARSIDTLTLTMFLIVTMTFGLNEERFVIFATIPLSILAAAGANRFISLRSVGLPLAGLLIALILFDANRDIRTLLTPIPAAPALTLSSNQKILQE